METETLCYVIAATSATYLLARAATLHIRVRRARRAYPRVTRVREAEHTVGPAAAIEWIDRCRGVLVGAAVGDALGLPAESLPRWLVRLRYPVGPRLRHGLVRFSRRPGDISDDTQLSICLARSIDASGRYLHPRFIDELRIWYGYRIGAGRACRNAARRLVRCPLHRGASEGREQGECGQASEGNGGAMRVGPLVIVHARDPSAASLLADVEQNVRLTHNSPAAVAAARLIALLIWHALREPVRTLSRDWIASLLPAISQESGFPTAVLEDALRGVGRFDRGLQSPSAWVHHSVPAVVYVLGRATLDFREAMRLIFFGGGDTDTVGAMVAAVLGAQLGLSSLPPEWSGRVQHRTVLVDLADRLSSPERPSSGLAGAVVDVEGDIVTRPVDVVVNAWNRNVLPHWLLVPQGVSRAIGRAGGKGAIREISRRAPMPLGSAWETPGYGLHARWIIHVAGIDLLWRGSRRSVTLSTRNALLLSRSLGARTVALPLMGSGSGGLPAGQVRGWMLEEIERHRQCFERIELVRMPDRRSRRGRP